MLAPFFLFGSSLLAIFRVLLIPFFGSFTTITSPIPICLYSFYMLLHNPKLAYLNYLIVIALLFSVPTFAFHPDLLSSCLAVVETLVPYVLIFSLPFKAHQPSSLISCYFRRLTLLIFSLLVFGMILQLIGVTLPVIKAVPVSREYFVVSTTRFSSFVGTSGPFALSLAYIVIACMLLYPKNSNSFLIVGILLELFSLSRSGLAVLVVYKILMTISSFRLRLSGFYKLRKSSLMAISFISIFSFIIMIQYFDVIFLTFNKFVMAFNFSKDPGSAERVTRSLGLLSANLIDPISIFLGHGTGSTARIIGGEQGESQIVKIFYEWGILGSTSLVFCVCNLLRKWNLNSKQYALIILFVLNMGFLQVFTSPPIYVSMAIVIWCSRIPPLISQNSSQSEASN